MTTAQDTATQDTALTLPFPRESVLEIAPLYKLLRDEGRPIVKVTTPAGDPAWLVVAHEEAKIAFSDRRFGYYVHKDPPNAARMTDAALHSAPMGGIDFEIEAGRLRKLFTPSLAPKRTRLMHDWIVELTEACLDDMEAAHDADPSAPVDYHELLGYKLPVLVICALLGVPEKDRDYVFELSDRMGVYTTGTDPFVAMAELEAYMKEFLDWKKDNLGEDMISDMIRAQEEDPGFFSTFPIEHYASGFVFPGHETTVARMDIGLLYLIADTSRRDWLQEDPEGRIDQVVEEVVRLTSAHQFGLMRYALEDIELGGVTIKDGDLVIISEASANRDEKLFEHSEVFDPTRNSKGHLAFGHGAHICIGQNLARTELRIVFPAVFRRFPELHLAGDVAGMRLNNDRIGGGLSSLPVTW
jgi:cytochrome P450